MKKYIVSFLVASIFLAGAPFAVKQASASDLSIRDFVNLLIIIGVIPADKIPVVNTYLATLDNTTTPYLTTTPREARDCPSGQVWSGSLHSCTTVTTTTNQPSISPTKATINSGNSVKFNFTYPRNTTNASISVICPLGITSGTSPELCNRGYMDITSTSDFTLSLLNSTSQTQSVDVSYSVNFPADGEYKGQNSTVVAKVAVKSKLTTESIKCVFNDNSYNVIQNCSAQNKDGKQYTFSGINTAVGEVSGYQSEKMTWKSSCGSYEYTVMDGDNDYAYFNCSSVQPSITILSPNGGEAYQNGEKIEVKWETNNVKNNQKFDVLRLRGYPNGGEYNLAYGLVNDGQEIVIPTNVPFGDYTLEIKGQVNGQSVMGSSDSYFKIANIQPTATILTSSRITATSPYIIGTASGFSRVGIVLSSESGDKVYGSGMVPVVNGDWSVTVTPALSLGNYTIYVYDANNNELTNKIISIVSSN